MNLFQQLAQCLHGLEVDLGARADWSRVRGEQQQLQAWLDDRPFLFTWTGDGVPQDSQRVERGDSGEQFDATRWHRLYPEIHRQWRLLELDRSFLKTARQPETRQQRLGQMAERLERLHGYCAGLTVTEGNGGEEA